MLHALLVCLLGWTLLYLAVILPLVVRKAAAGAGVIFLGVTSLTALAVLQQGSLRTASLIFLCSNWLLYTIVIALTGGIHSIALAFYLVLPICAAWLWGLGASLLTAGICIGSAFIFALLEEIGLPMPLYFTGVPFGIWSEVLRAMVIATVPVACILHVSKEALARSDSDQAALRQHQESLADLVEQRTAELSEARDQAQAANRAKSAFLANMSHELRNPLNAILGFSTLMRDEPGLSGEHRKDLDIINRSGEHLLDLIDDVLDVAKIEAGRVVVENSPFDLDALVRDAIESMRARSREKNLELALDASSVVPRFVRSDAGKLRQVILNLVGNAVKYTEHGSVTVRLDAHDMQDSSHPLLTIEVSDTGVGIAPEDQAHIFDPFVQAGQSGAHKGTGLGLSISRHFVQLMGGTIHVKSTHGIGSLFRVEVPVERAAEAEVMAAKRARERVVGLAPGQPEYRILIVEDKRENWLLLQRMLQDIGFRVRVAEDGAHGVEMYFTWRPHFIWMDLRLPDMEGVEAARRIRTLQGGQDVKIVAITASVFTGQRENVLAAGLDDCVRKPYGPGEIFDCMARQLGVRYLYREAAPVFAAETAAALRPEALAALPEQLRNELAYALTALDIERIREVIGGISKRDAELGAVLLGRADKFAYTFILRALEACSSRTAEEIL